MTQVDAALSEIAAALSVLQPQLEGLRDFSRLNLRPETLQIINEAITKYARREALLLKAQADLEELNDDGYPALGVEEILQIAYRDLQENVRTITAAFAQFAPNIASNLNLEPGDRETK